MIIVRIGEGLGNQLFEYAYARAWREKGLDVRLDMNKTYDSAFVQHENNDPRQNIINEFNITLPEINVEEYGKYDFIKQETIKDKVLFCLAKHGLWKYKFYEEGIQQAIKAPVCLKGNYYVRAWFQDERYFKQIRKILLEEITPRRRIRISRELRQALEYEESVSLHVRRGDYVKIRNTLNASYYNKAIETIKTKYRNPLFLVFSEDMDWVRRNLDVGDNCLFINEDRRLQDYEELWIMSRCKSNIISNSTFSWWGAWLNRNTDKMVIAPRKPWLSKQKNIIPREWTVI